MPDEVKKSIDTAADATASPSANSRARTATDDATVPRSNDRDTGAALRSVYQKTVDEMVPDEMLDLLGKLS